jgi:DNA adenine methylase
MTQAVLKPVLKYPGAKWKLASWIISHMPKHTTYLEPYFGSGAVFFQKPPSKVETINDLDGNVVNLFRVIRERPEELARLIEFTPWARDEYYASYEKTGDSMEDARRFLVRCWQAFGTRLNSRTGWRHDKSTLVMNKTSTWLQIPERILIVSKRLQLAQIENMKAKDCINSHCSKEVFLYVDPPYVLDTRAGTLYAHEMTDADHIELLEVLDRHPGPVLLSGYACQLYDERLKHWTRRTHKAQAEKGLERTEVLWINPNAAEGMTGRLFE